MNRVKALMLLGAWVLVAMPLLASSDVLEPVCPADFSEWKEWRIKAIRAAISAGYSSGINSMQMTIQSCRTSFEHLGPKKNCFDHIDRFSQQFFRTHTRNHSLALGISDSDYLSLLDSKGLGSLPSAFRHEDFLRRLDAAPDGEFAAIAHDMERIGPKGTMAFYYRSKHLPSVDDAAVNGRIMLYIPGSKVDIFSQFSVGRGKLNQLPNSISVISVVKLDSAGHKFDRPKVFFNDLWRIRGRKVVVLNRLTATKRMENCYGCHKSPLIPIYPEARTFDLSNDSGRLTSVNEIMSRFANAEHFSIDTEAYGPPMGVERLESLPCKGWGSGDLASEETVRCGDCHNGEVRGKLNFPSGLSIQLPFETSLVHAFVVGYGLMPPIFQDQPLQQREDIFKCLIEDYYGDFSDPKTGRFNQWLLQEDCG
ncbi:MAG: hypothetical protein NTY08_13480 [Proteobacteria bacterium]|nr:hypothetical protein [Pseudomonadota bacterium]